MLISVKGFNPLILSLALVSAPLSCHIWIDSSLASPPQDLKGAPVFPDARDAPPPDWSGPVFKLSQNYPETFPTQESLPWKTIDFRKDWRGYLASILQYALDGNAEVDWDLTANRTRNWFHAPWLHWGRNGREFIHGLTHERPSLPGELALTQVSTFQNWAVGIYNAPGGYTLGRVWKDPNNPDITAAYFPEGTVSLKLLFTQATLDEVPYLKGAKEWEAFIYKITAVPTNPLGPKSIQKVRLLQIDIAVKDSRANTTTGWIFGTFVYNGNLGGRSVWERMVPVGLMWGNDPDITATMTRNGSTLKESIVNSSSDLPFQHLGWAGRLNGPVDNPISSCLSCHSTSQWPAKAPVVPPRQTIPDSIEWMHWFRNLKPGEPFTMGAQSLDYSLQLGVGIQSYFEWKQLTVSKGGSKNYQLDSMTQKLKEITPQETYSFTRGE